MSIMGAIVAGWGALRNNSLRQSAESAAPAIGAAGIVYNAAMSEGAR